MGFEMYITYIYIRNSVVLQIFAGYVVTEQERYLNMGQYYS